MPRAKILTQVWLTGYSNTVKETNRNTGDLKEIQIGENALVCQFVPAPWSPFPPPRSLGDSLAKAGLFLTYHPALEEDIKDCAGS